MFPFLLVLTTVFDMQVVSNESKNSPLILFVKDIEKAMVGHSDAYSILKGRLENLLGNVVVIGSHTHMDSRKEKVSIAVFLPPPPFIPLRVCLGRSNSIFDSSVHFQSHPGGLLFTKFGSNQTALLDLAFPVCEVFSSICLFSINLTVPFFVERLVVFLFLLRIQ